MKANATFIFHNVGQGMFYTGDIRIDGNIRVNPFRFVYDCGAKPGVRNLRTAIERYYQDFGKRTRRINMLVLSHLHQDHVNGIDALLKKFKVERVILPYLPPIERLLMAIIESRIGAFAWYYQFLQDPVQYLLNNGVEQVILIGSGGEEERTGDEDFPPEPPTGEDLVVRNLRDDPNLEETLFQRENDPEWRSFVQNKKLLVKSHYGYVTGIGIWGFRFFNYKVSCQELSGFSQCLRNIPSSNIKQLIADFHQRNRLRGCYESHMRSLGTNKHQRLNNTSLVLFHAPLMSKEDDVLLSCPIQPYFKFRCRRRCFKACYIGNGHILTGDINLNFQYQEFIQHFHRSIHRICVSSVPHHGAKKNWNDQVLQAVHSPVWVISAGLNNRYGHPSLRVLKSIIVHNRDILWANEISPVIIKQRASW